jgi:hypothetical protein
MLLGAPSLILPLRLKGERDTLTLGDRGVTSVQAPPPPLRNASRSRLGTLTDLDLADVGMPVSALRLGTFLRLLWACGMEQGRKRWAGSKEQTAATTLGQSMYQTNCFQHSTYFTIALYNGSS